MIARLIIVLIVAGSVGCAASREAHGILAAAPMNGLRTAGKPVRSEKIRRRDAGATPEGTPVSTPGQRRCAWRLIRALQELAVACGQGHDEEAEALLGRIITPREGTE